MLSMLDNTTSCSKVAFLFAIERRFCRIELHLIGRLRLRKHKIFALLLAPLVPVFLLLRLCVFGSLSWIRFFASSIQAKGVVFLLLLDVEILLLDKI